jgi:hypothetical protein
MLSLTRRRPLRALDTLSVPTVTWSANVSAMTWTLEVAKADFAASAIHRELRPAARSGEVLVAIDNLAMTANTMTYAATGGELGYWSLFPASSASFGRVPAWGHGRVIASDVEGVDEGGRLFGLWPMASHVLLSGRRSRLGLRETSPWRRGVNPVYNQYALEPLASAEARARRAVFHPLFITSFVLGQHLLEDDASGPRQVVIVSASSKTAQGTSFMLKSARDSIGLTSRRHAAWVREAGMYDAVFAYDELERLAEAERCLVIDFSGDPQLQDRVVTALGRRCAALLRVGSTHGGAFAIGPAAATVPGSLFSGPQQIERRVAQWGPAEFDRRLAHALSAFTAAMQAHCTVDHRDGAEGTAAAWRAIQQRNVDASTLLIARPCPPLNR